MPRRGQRLSDEHKAKMRAGYIAYLQGGRVSKKGIVGRVTYRKKMAMSKKGVVHRQKAAIAMRYAWSLVPTDRRTGHYLRKLTQNDIQQGWFYADTWYREGQLGHSIKRRAAPKRGKNYVFNYPMPTGPNVVKLAPIKRSAMEVVVSRKRRPKLFPSLVPKPKKSKKPKGTTTVTSTTSLLGPALSSSSNRGPSPLLLENPLPPPPTSSSPLTIDVLYNT